MVYISETFLDFSILTNDEGLNMKEYKLVKAHNPSESKKGGVGIYQKEFLAFRPVEVKNLNEYLIFEMSIKSKRRYVVSLHKSPSQTKDEFDVFLISFEQVIDDIIAEKSFVQIKTNWWKNDLSTSEGTQVDSLTTSYGLSQIISDPTHSLPNSSSCFDLFFTNQPNLVTESGPQSRDPLRKTSIGNCPLNQLIHLRYQKPIGRYSNSRQWQKKSNNTASSSLLVASLSPTQKFQKKLTYLTNFSANSVSLYKIIVPTQNLIRIIQKAG